MKGYRSLIPIGLIVFMVLSIYTMISDATAHQEELNATLAEAKSYLDQKLYDKSVECYTEAINLDKNIDHYLQIIDVYYDIEDYETCDEWCEKTISDFPKNPDGYVRKLRSCIKTESYSQAFSTIDRFNGRQLSSSEVDEYYDKIKDLYFDIQYSYEEVQPVSMNGYIGFSNKDLWGLTTTSGSTKVEAKFREIGYFSNGLVPVMDEAGVWYFMEESGEYKYNISSFISGKIESVGVYNNDLFPVCLNGKYSYYDIDFNQKSGEYDYAGSFNNGVAAVRTGDKWQIIDSTGNIISGESYSNVIVDDRGICCNKDRIFVETSNGTYKMIDTQGNTIGSESFESAKLFSNGDYAAVKMNNLWGYVNLDGEVVIPAKYTDANSFSMNLAAVCKDYSWGYIDVNENIKIDFNYDECMDFSQSGSALVNEDSRWKIVYLYLYNH